MQKISIVFLVILLFVGAQAVEASFTPGEEFVYEVRYKNVKVGKSTLTFQGIEKLSNKEVYHITFFTKIGAFTDTEEIYADIETFLPIEIQRTLKHFGSFTTRITEKYDQEKFIVYIKRKTKFRKKEFLIEKDAPIHNAIVLSYYCRSLENLNKADRFKINLPNAEFDVFYNGIEKIETPLGEFETHAFTSEPPKFKLWLSTDEKRIPLQIKNPGKLGYSLVIKEIK